MQKKFKVIIIILVIVLLLFPFSHNLYEDGGTETFTSAMYKIILYNQIDGKEGIEIHLFPNNFHHLGYYDD